MEAQVMARLAESRDVTLGSLITELRSIGFLDICLLAAFPLTLIKVLRGDAEGYSTAEAFLIYLALSLFWALPIGGVFAAFMSGSSKTLAGPRLAEFVYRAERPGFAKLLISIVLLEFIATVLIFSATAPASMTLAMIAWYLICSVCIVQSGGAGIPQPQPVGIWQAACTAPEHPRFFPAVLCFILFKVVSVIGFGLVMATCHQIILSANQTGALISTVGAYATIVGAALVIVPMPVLAVALVLGKKPSERF
jgi:hypothetical protein